MTKQKSTKRALLMSGLALLMCVSMLIGSTFAWFTDSVTSGSNIIKSGTLDVALVDAAGESLEGEMIEWAAKDGRAQDEILWEPGCTYNTEEFYIENKGNLNLKFKFAVTGIDGDAKLLEVIDFSVMADASQMHFNTGAVSVGTSGTFDLLKGYEVDTLFYGVQTFTEYVLEPGDKVGPLVLSGHMDENAGNEYQNLTIEGIAVSIVATQATGEEDSFNGTYDENADYAIEVDTADELASALNADQNVVLTGNIALPNDWTPAGNGTRSGSTYTGDAYTGVLNGNGHTISNVTKGLFGVLAGTVKNVNLEAAIDESSDSVGAVAAVLAGGTVSNVTVSGSVSGPEAVGGVVGRVLADGNINECVNNAAVTSTGSNDAAGGIVGKAYYTVAGKEMNITNCENTGTISGKYAAGGIVGFSAANVIGCKNSGNVVLTEDSAKSAGGIIGEQTNYGEIANNTNTASIKVSDGISNAGGIIGWLRYQTSTAYATSEIVAISGNINEGSIEGTYTAGGIVGLAYNQALVTGNTNKAGYISAETFAAGIVGGLQVDANNLSIDAAVRFVVTDSTTTTDAAEITANCADEVAYNNDPGNDAFANISNNKTN